MKNTVFPKLRWVKLTHQEAEADKAAFASASPELSSGAAALREAIQKVGLPRAPPDTPPVKEAEFLLNAVSEVEHALLVQYLYAAYSIRAAGAPLAVRQRQKQLIKTAVEEMGHLITAQNLLLSIGASIYLNRDETDFGKKSAGNFPFPIRFEPLSLESLAKYVTAESPSPETIQDAALRARVEPIFQRAEQKAGRMVNHVGILFAYLFWLFQPTDEPHPLWPDLPVDLMPPGRHLSDSDFTNMFEERQALPEEFGPPSENVFILIIRSRYDALIALDMIAQQGEGWKLLQDSHFERFLDTYEKFATELADYIIGVPVNPNTFADGDPTMEQSRITHEAALRWAKLLNVRYRLVLIELGLAMLQPRTSDDGSTLGRSALISTSLENEMRNNIKIIVTRLNNLPLHPDSPAGEVAGVPFELPDGSFPTDASGLRLQLREALMEARQLMGELENLPAPNQPSSDDLDLINSLRYQDDSMLAAIEA
ncbi:MAG TPA: ferritin-like domain-containing protein [Pyrinomonadaceae bacterium]|jgi:hypothetical protein